MLKFLCIALFSAAVVGQMTQAQRNRILSDHNDKRRSASNAANMIELRYDMVLEQVAQAYLQRGCGGGFQHNPNRACDYKNRGGTNAGTSSSGCPSVGENWYSGAPDNTTGTDVVIGGAVAQWTDGTCSSWASPPLRCGSRWCSEKQNFYQSGSDSYGSCSQFSGQTLHFTQAMWATTTHVGCGYTTACGTLCNYAPGGNFNLPPMGSMREGNLWKIGTRCSQCPSGYTRCNNGLCSAGSGATTCPADTTNKPTNGGVGTCGSSIAVGSTCTQTCNTGYTLTSGSLTRSCSTSGTLSAVTAVCSAVTCPADSTTKPTNGNPGTCNTARTYGQTCTMACNTGYTLTSGSLVRTCGSSGGYGGSTAVCSAVTCPADTTTKPTNGNAGTCASSKTYGQTCAMACNSGFYLSSGSLIRTCGSSGTFSTSSAVCTANTPAPTQAPATPAPTYAPVTSAPATAAPATAAPATAAPATAAPATAAPTAAYCTSGPTSDLDTEFGVIRIIGHASQIYDNTGCPGSTSPSINTHLRVTVAQGETYSLSFDRTTCGDYYNALAGAWIDWNQDKSFSPSELLFPYTSQYGLNEVVFTVPLNAKLGATRLRLQIQETDATSLNPCAMFEWGDTKDYSVNVIQQTPQIVCPGDLSVSPVNGNPGTCMTTKSYAQVCTQRCNTGYRLTAGSLDSPCTATGRYAASTAICSPITGAMNAVPVEATPEEVCLPDGVSPANGAPGTCGQNSSVGSTCTQECNPGFTLRAGSLERQCTSSGYSASTAVCE